MGEYYDPTKHDISKYPEKPAHFKNFEKARQVHHQNLLTKRSLETHESNKGKTIIPDSERSDKDILYGPEIRYEETPLPDPRDVLYEPDLWFDHCEKTGKRKKPGRPKLPPEKLKHRPIKRSIEMKELLLSHGYKLDANNYVSGFDKVRMMPNGRLHFEIENIKISVHQFIKEYL